MFGAIHAAKATTPGAFGAGQGGVLIAPVEGGPTLAACWQESRPAALDSDEDLASYMRQLREKGVAVSIVIPALNEEENLRALLPRLPELCELVIVDGHSTDQTVEAVRETRPDAIVVQQAGRGKGDALICGFAATSGDIIVTMDADGSTDPGELASFLRTLMDGADFAKGSRRLGGGGSTDLTLIRRLGNCTLIYLFNLIYSRKYTDLCYGYNAFWRDCIQYMPTVAQGFEIETQMHAWMAQAPVKVVEVPSFELARRFGSSHLRPFQDGLRVARVMIRGRTRAHRNFGHAEVIDLRESRIDYSRLAAPRQPTVESA